MPICMHPAAQIITHARDMGAYTTFHQGEIPYLCATSALNDAQKVLWLWLAHRTAPHPQHCIQYAQEYMGARLGRSRTAMNLGLKALRQAGFLKVEGMHRHAGKYFIQLPADGMAALAKDTRLRALKKDIAPTLRDYRKNGHYSRFSRAELDFVLEHPDLSNLEKLTWCFLANEGALMPELRVRHAYKALGTLLGKKENTMNKVIDSLKAQGFVHFKKDYEDFRHWYTLSLPASGLSVLQAAPVRAGAKARKAHAKSQRQSAESEPSDFFAHQSDILQTSPDQNGSSADEKEHRPDKKKHHLSTDLSTACSKAIITTNSCLASVDLLSDDPPITGEALEAATQQHAEPTVTATLQREALEKAQTSHLAPVATSPRVWHPQYLALRAAMRSQPRLPFVEVQARMHARFADPAFGEKVSRFYEAAAAAKEAAYLAGICPEREAWARPLPDATRYRPPGHANTSMSERVCNFWIRHVNTRKDAIKADPESTPPLTEEEQNYQWRALRAPRLEADLFPKGSPFADMGPEARLAQVPRYMALLQEEAHLPVEEVRHWRRIVWERSCRMGFEGPLNFYVFDSFCPLAQVLIRLSLRSPTPPYEEKIGPSPRQPRRKPAKAAYGDYPVIAQLEARVRADIPRFIQEREFHPDVAKRGAPAITEEVLFYLAKHRCVIQQSDCLKMAYMVCRNGKWDTPIGMYMT